MLRTSCPLSSVSSMMLGALIKARTTAEERSGRIVMARPHARLEALLKAVKLDGWIDSYDSVEAAMAALQS